MKTGTIFSGIGGVDLGAKNAGAELAWGIEINPDAAAVANRNLGNHVIVADALQIDPSTLPCVEILHVSPECTRVSIANASTSESQLDMDMAHKVVDFISILKPKIFTLENVVPYRKSKSWRIISNGLANNGYWVSVENCNAADFGVPQIRNRMIVRAARGMMVPRLPSKEKHVSWYDSTADLHASLSKIDMPKTLSRRVPNMDDILRDNIKAFVVKGNNRRREKSIHKLQHEPLFTVTESQKCVHRIWSKFRLLRADVRCLLRWQSFPGDYTDSTLGIGNAVPPLMYQKIISQLMEYAQ